ncbi:MAG: hypothetical protein ACREWG_03990 [Gammaproteobacteria bacterium]
MVAVAEDWTTQGADVFARRERQPAAISLLEPRRVNKRLRIGNHVIEIYFDASGGLPSWVKPVLQSLDDRWGGAPGWDSYDAEPTKIQHVVRLLNHLSELLRDSSTPPIITPLSDGGVQAEWHRNNEDLEIVLPAGESARYFYYNAATQEEEGGELSPPRFEHLRTLIADF